MAKEVNMDVVLNGRSYGDVAGKFQSSGRLDIGSYKPFIGSDGRAYVTVYKGGDPSKKESYITRPINTNATLRRDEWKQLDEALVAAKRYRLGGIEDLRANGLVYNLGNAMGTTVLEWHDVSDNMEAILTMDGVTRSPNDRPKFQTNYLPIPILHVDYEINARELEASRKLGNPLDTTMAEMAARRINEKLENMLFTDVTYAYGTADDRSRNKIYGYLNHPDRNTVSMGTAWDASATTGANIVDDVNKKMKQALIDARHYGPYMIYIPTNYETTLDDDYDATTPGTTIRERIMKIGGIKGIKVIDSLPADNVLMVQMTPDVVRLINGFDLTNVEWGTEGGMLTKYKVMSIQVPQIRSDQNGRSGICHMS